MALAPALRIPFKPQNGVADVKDEFYYGHRMQVVEDAEGRADYLYMPLTQDDFLEPQEGDHFVQGTLHEKDVERVKSIYRHVYAHQPRFTVYSDLKIVWGVEGIKNPAPDVAVIPDVIDPDKPRGQFEVQKEGTRPVFVLEMVSPRYVDSDYEKKVPIYEQAGISEYIIIDSGLRDWDDEVDYTVEGYRLHQGRYVPITPDERGWIYSEVSQVWIGITLDRDTFFVIDARTGEHILPDIERVQIAEERAEAAEEQAEAAKEEAKSAKVEAEAAKKQAKAAKEEAEAAKEQAQKEADARAAAEQHLQQETAARLAAEQRQRELEAEITQLRAAQR